MYLSKNDYEMPRVLIHNIPVISFDYSMREKYWGELSQLLINNHGKGPFQEHLKVEEILIESFGYFTRKFKELLVEETNLTFYLYLFWLHEESIKLHRKLLEGLELYSITENEFATYRRVLKNILEQGCNHNLSWGAMPNAVDAQKINNKLQDLLYLGTWMYGFADEIALQKMIEQCHKVYFDDEDLLVVDWQFHYGYSYKQLFPSLRDDYEQGIFDQNSVVELRAAIEQNFGITYDYGAGIIFQIKEYFSPQNPTLQTIEPYVLPENLAAQFGINVQEAKNFYNGLTISAENKMSVEDLVLKPYNLNRYMFRPILVYTIDGVKRALVGWEKFGESILVLATNAIHWNNIPVEWAKNKGMQKFINKKSHEHDRILEDRIESIFKENVLPYARNIKSFKRPGQDNLNIDNNICGEIDFIVININLNKIFVADVKYNRSKYEACGYRSDYTNFINTYERKIELKRSWVEQNKQVVQDHLKMMTGNANLDILNYEVEGVFFINTPTFYMFNGKYKAITMRHLKEFILGTYNSPVVKDEVDGKEIEIKHPYFKKPLD